MTPGNVRSDEVVDKPPLETDGRRRPMAEQYHPAKPGAPVRLGGEAHLRSTARSGANCGIFSQRWHRAGFPVMVPGC